MRCLSGLERKEAERFIDEAVNEAKKSTSLDSKCGSIIVNHGVIAGRGYNSPPGHLESQRRCLTEKTKYHKKVVDKTCCIHAEHRAIRDALINQPEKIRDSRLYFIRLDMENNILFAGNPYCTHCSKFALDEGISEFVLWHEKGICVYNTEEYNDISYGYGE